MSEPIERKGTATAGRTLTDAIRQARDAAADRDDVVIDLMHGQRSRLELLAEQLAPVISDVPREDDRFDFVISSGIQPRLWIDAVAHVTMARDRRTYRFLRDTRLGRVVLAETADLAKVADSVTGYIAERMVERQRLIEGEPVALASPATPSQERPAAGPVRARTAPRRSGGGALMRGLGILALGALFGAAVTLAIAWQRLAEFGYLFR